MSYRKQIKRLLSMALGLAAASIASLGHATADRPATMLAFDWDPVALRAIVGAIEDHDYLSFSIKVKHSDEIRSAPTLFFLPPSLKGVAARSGEACSVNNRKHFIIYNPEHWIHTPAAEQDNIVGSVSMAEEILRQNKCFEFGLALDARTIGIRSPPCRGMMSELSKQIDWSKIKIFIIQAQGLLSDGCRGAKNIDEYHRFIREWIVWVKLINPKIKFFASMSFNLSSAETMKAAVARTRALVDGYYIAYPINPTGKACKYCNAASLAEIVKVIKGPA